MDPGQNTAEWLKSYGPWGVVVLCIAAIIALWRRLITEREAATAQLTKEREAATAQLVALTKEHKAEMAVLLDRLIASSNVQVEKFSDLAEQSARVVEALTRKVKPKGEAPT